MKLSGAYNPLKVEEEVRKFWDENRVEEKWRAFDPGKKTFTFLEGPPTTNGMPHVGHVRGRTYKDVVLRFWRLQGYSVWAQGGWDMQGLPVELEIEQKFGLKTKKDIERLGLEKFSRECNALDDYYLQFWEEWGTRRLGLWLDLKNAYQTRRPYYLEYTWRVVKRAYERGLLAEDYRVLWFCPRCETSLSDHEVDLGYAEREDPSIYVKFRVEGAEDEYLVVWTTTPWTIVDNEAVAVNPNFNYAKVEVLWRGRRERWWLAEGLVQQLMQLFGVKEWRILEVKKGSDLAGLRYVHPLAEEVPERAARAHQVYPADFVTLEQGTGLVHIAPGHGPEDFELAQRHGINVTNSVEINGVYNSLGGKYAGMYVFDVDKKVVEDLEAKGLLVYKATIRHEYPHCWRCGTKLILRADRQWFIRISKIRGDMYEELRRVRVYPEKLRDRFDVFVQNARDWNISRSRVWGSPLPIWRCQKDGRILVVGSIEELKRLAKSLPPVDDFWLVHRPWIDQVVIETPDCDKWVREPYVMDVWLDSGVAWIAAVDGERNRDLWSRLYPYDWVTEAIDQTRGWFYSLLASSMVYTGRAPYKAVLITGHIVDKYGQKMSKSKGNVVWAKDLLSKYGADPVRLYLLTKAAPWETLSFDVDEVKGAVSQLNILWNVVKFADTYMELDGFSADRYKLEDWLGKALDEDRWLLSELNKMAADVKKYMESFELHNAAKAWLDFVVETLSHRYIRLLRRRVWSEEPREDKYAAYAVLFHAIKAALVVGSMFVPHVAEYLWQSFVKKYDAAAPESVHLAQYPEPGPVDEELLAAYEELFDVFSIVAEARNKAGIKLRWPVSRVVVNGARRLDKYASLLAYLANAKSVEAGDCGGDDYVRHEERGVAVCVPAKLEPELYYEALARELVRRIQVMRKEMNLAVNDDVEVYVETDDEGLKKAVESQGKYISGEVRAVKLALGAGPQDSYVKEWEIEEAKAKIYVRRA
ncbi:MAG: isoleucine--tRNA ligase [Thermoproteus sp. AZ2]|uniref:Isoleucine--tRNA ligase n=1 Tax=Thermoproteus sp. AZ2 TaxID=1609232 RepID=A0ACC6V2Z8_9CREN